ncbi:hypothetical protein UB33_11070 [Photobacterium angustum]|uniref:TnsA endonuclease N-terminal domain-containing protein n=1 Tax=Photobacterium angustum TaxID=661 RepID=UPI0005DBB585|nr:TnsA endonuclease N-terminal domain-containing protein [Photobacterium angustum]KJG05900.1 hypothetical protein UB33_11070 [Photobacterium angustum]PSV92608.1 hypothetical protein CTN01_12335 [Photobacterium angustum]
MLTKIVQQPFMPNEIIRSLNLWKREIAKSHQYLPFVTVRQVNKVGRRHWIYCPRQGRDVHLLSDGELSAYKILLWQPETISVEEQYALDIDETLDIAVSSNIIHPRDWKTNFAHIMTTDFVRTKRTESGAKQRVAYTFKYWNQLYEHCADGSIKQINPRTWQKFAIEREYWRRRGVAYRVITERDTTKTRVWNINYFELAYDLVTNKNELVEFGEAFIESWSLSPRAELQNHLSNISKQLGTTYRRSQSLFQYSGLHHLLPIDTTNYIRLFRPVGLNL